MQLLSRKEEETEEEKFNNNDEEGTKLLTKKVLLNSCCLSANLGNLLRLFAPSEKLFFSFKLKKNRFF